MMRIQKIPLEEYKRDVVAGFNPVKFDAEQWVRLIKSAGMKFVVITAKHHDGFAMYPSKVTNYNIHDATKFKRDPMRELSEACRRNGIKFGFYYSHAFDWEDPNAPGNDWDYDNPGGDRHLHGGLQWYDQNPELLVKARRYVDAKAIPQVKELITNYHPDILWFDTPSKLPLSENLRILKAVRETSTTVVVNGRLANGKGHSFGDYKDTSDRAAEFFPTEGDWESIPTTNESYGYHKHDLSHKPSAHFVQLLAKAAARGGNILLNIGPMGDGQIDGKDQEILKGIGGWLSTNGESIYGTESSPLPVQPWGESTRRGNRLYLHVFSWPRNGKLVVGGLKNTVTKSYLLGDPARKALDFQRVNADDVLIRVPANAPDKTDTVVVVEFQGDLKVNAVRLISSSDQTNVLRTFDGEIHGSRLRFGDGKAPKAYVFEWTETGDWIGWKIRLDRGAEFSVKLKYTTASAANNGTYTVRIGGQVLKATVQPTANENEQTTTVVGRVKLVPGEYVVEVRPQSIAGGELMRLFHLELEPVDRTTGEGVKGKGRKFGTFAPSQDF
jgi:alpha-L-fucosidase